MACSEGTADEEGGSAQLWFLEEELGLLPAQLVPRQRSQDSSSAGLPCSEEGLELLSPPVAGSLESCCTDALDKTAHGGCSERFSRSSVKAGTTGRLALGM